MHGCVAAIAKGEFGIYENQRSNEQEHRIAAVVANLQSTQSPGIMCGSTSKSDRQCNDAAAVPINSLLPPLIDQPAKLWSDIRDDTRENATEDVRTATAMEMWENYIATAHATTWAEDTMGMPRAAATAAAISSGASFTNATHSFTPAVAAATPPLVPLSAPVVTLRSIPEALCALIERCTATPLVCLTLSDQQCQVTAVRDLLRALLTIMQSIDANSVSTTNCETTRVSHSLSCGQPTQVAATVALDLQALRLAALKGVSQVLSTYLDGADGTTQAPESAPRHSQQPGMAQSTKGSEALTAGLDSLDILSVFEDVTHQWAHALTLLAADKGPISDSAGVGGGVDVEPRGDRFGAAGSPPGHRSCEDGSGAAAQLHWVLRVTYQIIAAEQLERRCATSLVTPRARLLPPLLVPLALRTLSLISTVNPLACRTASYAQSCVDVLWGASLLAPGESARQLLYGSMGDSGLAGASSDSYEGGAGISRGADASPPAMDLFLTLLHQFNEGHSAAHCELRNNLVCLLASLLRYDIQRVEDALVARRGAHDGIRRTVLESLSYPSTSPPSVEAHDTPLTLNVATVEAINAVAALLFEITCGTELTTTTHSATTTAAAAFQSSGVDSGESVPVTLLSLDATRRHALRFQSIVTSVARRREMLDFKIYGWQLLTAHCDWQLAHLTYRELIRYHDPAAPAVDTALDSHHQCVSPVEQVIEEDNYDGAVTAALCGICLSQVGFLDVLIMYVDTRTDEVAVVAWTQEELLQLEVEAWQLLTSMILFAQHLDTKSGGLQPRCHCRYNRKLSVAQQQQREGSPLLSKSVEAVEKRHFGEDAEHGDRDMDSVDTAKSGILYGAGKHFIAAGGLQVALRYLHTAPPEAEAVKRWALITLAAVARTSSTDEAHGDSGSYTSQELTPVQRALAQHAPSLIPFLVKLIREVDVYVDTSGVPAALPPLISSITAPGSATTPQHSLGHRSVRENNGTDVTAATPTYDGVCWNWMPQSVAHVTLAAWSLLRCIGDVLLAEAGSVRGLELSIMNEDSSEEGDPCNQDEDAIAHESHPAMSVDAPSGTASARGRECVRSDRASVRSRSLEERQPHDEVDLPIPIMSSSGSSMGSLVENGDNAVVSGHGCPAARSPNRVSAPSHTRALSCSAHSPVLRIPNLFAEQGGVDLLTSWLRHVMRLCLSAHPQQQQQQQQRSSAGIAPQLTREEVASLENYGNIFLLLLDVFRAIVMGCKANETQFAESDGVHVMLDLMEAYALAHGLIDQAARHARLTVVDSFGSAAVQTADHKEQEGVLTYATTLLSDLLGSCPRAIDSFSTWRSSRIAVTPLTPDVRECQLPSDGGIEAVQLLLCLWASEIPARACGGALGSIGAVLASTSGLKLLRLHLRPAVRMALKEEYVCCLLHRHAELGVLQAETIRNYYLYLHSEVAPATASLMQEGKVTDAAVLAYMESLISRSSRRSAVDLEQQIDLLLYHALGLCIKVYACLSTIGFDSLRTAEAETLTTPSMGLRLSSLERSFLVQIAALPALCVDEISVAMAEVSLEHQFSADAATSKSSNPGAHDDNDATMWRPTTPDRRVLCTAAQEAAVRAGELDQLIEVGAQVQHARESQLYNRFLVTQLRQPVGRPADGRPGAVKGLWKTQRRLSASCGSGLGGSGDKIVSSAAELAVRLSTRLAAEHLQRQQLIASTVHVTQQLGGTKIEDSVGEVQSMASPHSNAPSVLGSSRTPYASIMGSVSAATHERLPDTLFSVVAPPQRPSVSLPQRHQQRQAMIARSLRKLPQDQPTSQSPHKP
ncbi:hypothetical protein Q4I28_003021 [Leishmania naiffi]|uniref:Separase n=1 Tax=Leishmania naiffi TaxID=5678 RepID=A0AAW3BX42_9TRYP